MSERDKEKMEDALRRKQEEAKAKAEEAQIDAHARGQDDGSPRQKGSGHKKVTADKWNQ